MRDATLTRQVGALVRRLRIKAGYSQEEFAHLCGIHRTYMGAIERGEKAISIVMTAKICKALDLPLSHFFVQLEETQTSLTAKKN